MIRTAITITINASLRKSLGSRITAATPFLPSHRLLLDILCVHISISEAPALQNGAVALYHASLSSHKLPSLKLSPSGDKVTAETKWLTRFCLVGSEQNFRRASFSLNGVVAERISAAVSTRWAWRVCTVRRLWPTYTFPLDHQERFRSFRILAPLNESLLQQSCSSANRHLAHPAG